MIDRIIIGGLFIICGILVMFCHERVIKMWSDMNGYDIWTGRFTRGGKILIWLAGAVLSFYGLLVAFGFIQ